MKRVKKVVAVVVSVALCCTLIFGVSTPRKEKTTLSLTPPPRAPAPQFFKTLLDKKKKQINISWTKVSSASGYYIYRGTSTKSMKRIKKITSNKTLKYKDKKVKKGKKYFYYIQSYEKIEVENGDEPSTASAIILGKKTQNNTVFVNKNTMQHKNVEKIKWGFKSYYVNTNSYVQILGNNGIWPKKGVLSKTRKYVSSNENLVKIDSNGYIKTQDKKGSCYVYAICHNGLSAKTKIHVSTYSNPKKVKTKGKDKATKKIFKSYKKSFSQTVNILLSFKAGEMISYYKGSIETNRAYTNDQMKSIKKLLSSKRISYIVKDNNGNIVFVLTNLHRIDFVTHNSKTLKDGKTMLKRMATCIYWH
jgi:hypothetical protein